MTYDLRYHKPRPELYAKLSREEIEKGIAQITTLLQGPMSDLERKIHHADRADLRAALAKLGQSAAGN